MYKSKTKINLVWFDFCSNILLLQKELGFSSIFALNLTKSNQITPTQLANQEHELRNEATVGLMYLMSYL